jgi:hypothetical protein
VDLGQRFAQRRGDPRLVLRLEIGEEEADRHRLRTRVLDLGDQALDLPLGQLALDPLGADALGRLEAQPGVGERSGLRRTEAVELGAVLAPDLEQVREPLGGDQRRAGAALLEQRVGSDGHAVGEGLDLGGRAAGALQHRLDRAHHPLRLVLRGRGDLGGVDLAAVEHHRVGERSADIDAEQHAAKLSRPNEKEGGPPWPAL